MTHSTLTKYKNTKLFVIDIIWTLLQDYKTKVYRTQGEGYALHMKTQDF